MFNRIPILALALTLAVLFSNLMMVVEAETQRIGAECNWKKNCQSHADGVDPSWANGEITCAVPQSNSPETCGSDDHNKSAFYGYVYSNLSSHFTFSWLKALTDVLFLSIYGRLLLTTRCSLRFHLRSLHHVLATLTLASPQTEPAK